MHVPLGCYLHRLARSRIATHTSDPDLAEEAPEPAQLHPVPLAQSLGDLVQDRVQSFFRGKRGQMRIFLSKLCQQL